MIDMIDNRMYDKMHYVNQWEDVGQMEGINREPVAWKSSKVVVQTDPVKLSKMLQAVKVFFSQAG